MSEEKLILELNKIQDGEKPRIIKKYNLSLYDIKTIIAIINGDYKEFLQLNVFNLLQAYKFNVQIKDIGYEVL